MLAFARASRPLLGARQQPGPAAAPALPADIRPGAQDLKLGDSRDGLVYVPKGYAHGVPTPLIVMLHGAGGTSQSVAYTFPLADEFGVIILGVDSRDESTWDLLLHGYGPDVEFIGAALRQTRARFTVDPQRMVLGGHSDGASYSLSLGLGTGDVFTRIMAFSPGMMRPAEVRGKPKIFISHGASDPIMPPDATSRQFVPRLKGLGYDVTYREYEGRHAVPAAVVREAFEWFMK
jgi:phospholipase/carboxylesterase